MHGYRICPEAIMLFQTAAKLMVDGRERERNCASAEDRVDSRRALLKKSSACVVDPRQYPNWNEMVCSLPNHSIFHSLNWAGVLADAYGYSPRYFAVMDREQLLALIPLMMISSPLTGRRGVSLPFTDFCDPLATSETHLRTAMASLLEYGCNAGWKYLEFRGQGCISPDTPYSEHYYGHILPLAADPEQVAASFRESTMRNIRKAVKSGVTVGTFYTAGALEDFQRLNCITRKAHGVPPQPATFFEGIQKHVISQGLGCVVLASYRGETIAGAVFFNLGMQAVYKFGASDRRFQTLRANNLVMWEGIRRHCAKGCTVLSLGRTDHEGDGLRQFKNGWGATEIDIRYYRYHPTEGWFSGRDWVRNGLATRLFRALPIPILKAVGFAAYRHIG
jgi:hypothetical protein